LSFNGKEYWNIEDSPCTFFHTEDKPILPSDTFFRNDIDHIVKKNWEAGELFKE